MQNKKLLISVISGLAALSFMTETYAVMSVPYGWYVEGNAGSSHLSNINFGTGSSSSSGIGGNANIGYKFMPFLGVEVGYSQYATSNINTPNGTKAAQATHFSYDMAIRGILPISDSGVEAFAKLGAERITTHVTIKDNSAANQIGLTGNRHSSTGLYMGAGGQIYFYPEFAVVAQWQRAQGSSSTGTEDLYSLGLSFLID
jgi:opacity protein-like surface antigen